ncbi:MAG: DnaJ C-terminal domain-containing protein, partial [Patescibacteria group bacterium]
NMQVQMACQDCRGEGKNIKEKCKNCSGTGVCEKITNLKIKIPAGINNGETIRLSGQGEAGEKGGQAGDLYLIIKVNLDKRFIREGYEIKSEATISFTQAVLGDKIEVETVDGPVKLKIPEGTESGTVFNLRGRGVIHLQGRGRGDHLVKVKIKTPKNLNRKQKKMLEELGI